MSILKGFDANEVEPVVGFAAIPAGDYLAYISASATKATKDGKGELLELTFDILEGPNKGAKVFARLNLKNESDQAVRMARGELSSICRAVGVMRPNDSSELHDIPLMISVTQEKRRDNGEMSNRIKGYRKKGEAAPVAAVDAGSVPPWKQG